ncbi:MAG TPA: hypothetical protein VHZ98_10580, partial [Galbitalea sp.]|nr:hypothetical protein [Galbitalea sp.]
LLCKHHHLLFHNNGWEIERNAQHQYWLIPPKSHHPEQTPIPLQPKDGNMRDLHNTETLESARRDAPRRGSPPQDETADEFSRVLA